ncbi:MAG: DUF4855 domain-containing protein [Victivallaceae bacterium]|nr:DUF4855 domain-containing protein [Victivallaceae bacterium]
MDKGYPRPETAGFHHCALVYEDSRRREEDFLPCVAKHVPGEPPGDWAFDAFLFLIHGIRGRNTEIDKLTMTDFQTIIERYFAPGRYIDALDRAVGAVAAVNGAPPSRRKVIIAIPWLNPQVEEFGLIGGRKVSLATQTGRDAAIRWYVDEIKRRFEGKYRHLELWGFYWMRENISSTPRVVKAAAGIIHAAGLRLLWIPYYMASGHDRWRDFDVDVAIMQSNYIFNGFHSGGACRANRLTVNARRCRECGLGFEIELFGSEMNAEARHSFYRTLEAGWELGYQHGTTAYYLGGSLECSRSADPEQRAVYAALCDYLAGKRISAPRHDSWEVRRDGDRVIANCRFETPTRIGNVDVFFNEPGEPGWHGRARLTGVDASGTARPLGWALRTTRDPDDLNLQALTVPAGAEVIALELELDRAAALDIAEISVDRHGVVMNLSAHCAAPTFEPAGFDRAVNAGTDVGVLHGFYAQETEIFREYRPDFPVECDEVTVETAPGVVSAALVTRTVAAANGCGPAPDAEVFIAEIGRGKLSFRFPARRLEGFAVAERVNGFAGFGKVAFRLGGKPVGTVGMDSVGHRGTAHMGGLYYDDGVVATTGVVYPDLNGMLLWHGAAPRELVFASGGGRELLLKFMYGILQNAEAPAAVEYAVSDDGRRWSRFCRADVPLMAERRNLLRPINVCVPSGGAAWIRLRVTGNRGKLTLLRDIERLF